jgi:hypothetical protein
VFPIYLTVFIATSISDETVDGSLGRASAFSDLRVLLFDICV